jgi:hypothetical protein
MGCSMHATARVLAVASLLQKHPGSRPAEIKRLLFLHFYGAEFEPGQRQRIAAALREPGGSGLYSCCSRASCRQVISQRLLGSKRAGVAH